MIDSRHGLGRTLQAAVAALASLKLTFATVVAFAVLVAASYLAGTAMVWPVAAPMLVLSLNLVAAIATNAAFRRQLPLLVFHVALLLLALLVAVGRLSELRGAAEVTVGGEFEGLASVSAGPLHFGAIDRVRFANDGFAINYLPGVRRDQTRNRVRWVDEAGISHSGEIGDNRPLVLHGFRFYPSHNKGFAPIFRWQPHGGAAVRGSVHLPSYPLNDLRQSRDFQLPGSSIGVWCQLEIQSEIIRPDERWDFAPPKVHELVCRRDALRWTMRPGDRQALAEGVVEYESLGTWMGYQVFYDWTLPWLLAVATLAVASLGWHFWSKFSSRPW